MPKDNQPSISRQVVRYHYHTQVRDPKGGDWDTRSVTPVPLEDDPAHASKHNGVLENANALRDDMSTVKRSDFAGLKSNQPMPYKKGYEVRVLRVPVVRESMSVNGREFAAANPVSDFSSAEEVSTPKFEEPTYEAVAPTGSRLIPIKPHGNTGNPHGTLGKATGWKPGPKAKPKPAVEKKPAAKKTDAKKGTTKKAATKKTATGDPTRYAAKKVTKPGGVIDVILSNKK